MSRYFNEDYLEHSGVKGQKWGIRRYQNEDGTLTDEGRKRYGRSLNKIDKLNTQASKYTSKASKSNPKLAKLKIKSENYKVKANMRAGMTGMSDFDKQLRYKVMPEKTKRIYERNMRAAGALDSKAAKIQYKVDKLNYKADKKVAKGYKIAKNLSKKFDQINTSDFDEETLRKARKYTQNLLADAA